MPRTIAIATLILGLGLATPAAAEGDDPHSELAALVIAPVQIGGPAFIDDYEDGEE